MLLLLLLLLLLLILTLLLLLLQLQLLITEAHTYCAPRPSAAAPLPEPKPSQKPADAHAGRSGGIKEFETNMSLYDHSACCGNTSLDLRPGVVQRSRQMTMENLVVAFG